MKRAALLASQPSTEQLVERMRRAGENALVAMGIYTLARTHLTIRLRQIGSLTSEARCTADGVIEIEIDEHCIRSLNNICHLVATVTRRAEAGGTVLQSDLEDIVDAALVGASYQQWMAESPNSFDMLLQERTPKPSRLNLLLSAHRVSWCRRSRVVCIKHLEATW